MTTSPGDRLVFFAVNLWVYLRHPLFTLKFLRKQAHWPNFARPGELAELMQWRKLFDRNPLFPVLADKLAVRGWVAERCPELPAPDVVWVGDRADDIPEALISAGYVLKTNNSTAQNHFPGRHGTDRAAIVKRFRDWDRRSLAGRWRRLRAATLEWGYDPIKRRIFAERLLPPPLVDIDVRACNGTVFLIVCGTGYKTAEPRYASFFPDGLRLPPEATSGNYGPLPPDFVPPAGFEDAVDLARRLSRGLDYARVDFLAAGGQLYLSEITIYPASGYGAQNWRADVIYRHWLANIGVSWVLRAGHPWPFSLYVAAFRRWVDQRAAELGPPQAFVERQRAAVDAQ